VELHDFAPNVRKIAAIAYGEASPLDLPSEIGGIAFAVANRARAWNNKTIEQLLLADKNYTYAATDGNQRFLRLMKADPTEIQANLGMYFACQMAKNALDNVGRDPSCGAFWWDGLDFRTNYANHPKVADGFRFGDKAHNIFQVQEVSHEQVTYWTVKDAKGREVRGKERGRYSCVWVSTAAQGSTIFWRHDPDYLDATGCKSYR
jgi:hypothetical protein